MNNDLIQASEALAKNGVQRLHKALGQRIEVVAGTLWITLDNDPRDIVLNPGEGFTIDAEDDVLLSALDDARFVRLEAPLTATHWWKSLGLTAQRTGAAPTR